MLSKDLQGTVQRQRFDRMALARDGGGPKERVVNGLFGGFDDREEERRHRIVA